MGRSLIPSEAAAALRRGATVEQFVSLHGGEVQYLTASGVPGRYEVRRHRVHDQGRDDFRDISEFSPVDDDEYVGEGLAVGTFAEPSEAVGAASAHGGAPDRWVNQGVAADEYWVLKN